MHCARKSFWSTQNAHGIILYPNQNAQQICQLECPLLPGIATGKLNAPLLFLDMASTVCGIFTSKSYVTRSPVGGPQVRPAESPCPVKPNHLGESVSDQGMATEDEWGKHHKDRQDDSYSG